MLIFLTFYINYYKIFSTFVFIILSKQVMNTTFLLKEAKAWVKRRQGPDEIVRVVPDIDDDNRALTYKLYVAYGANTRDLPDEKNPDYLGQILFDTEGYWIYDGEELTIAEQEQLAKFIINYVEVL